MSSTLPFDCPVKFLDLDHLESRAADYRFRLARYDEVFEGLRLAENAVGGELTSAGTLAFIDSVTHCANWVTGYPVDGFFVIVPLTELGVHALIEGRFSTERPLKIWLSQAGKDCAGVYIGVIAGANRAASGRVMLAASRLREEFFADVYCFARGVTNEGCRAMRSLSMRPYPNETSSLFVQEPLTKLKGEAA